MLSISILTQLKSLFVIQLAPPSTEQGRQSIALHYISSHSCIDTSGVERGGGWYLVCNASHNGVQQKY